MLRLFVEFVPVQLQARSLLTAPSAGPSIHVSPEVILPRQSEPSWDGNRFRKRLPTPCQQRYATPRSVRRNGFDCVVSDNVTLPKKESPLKLCITLSRSFATP